MKVGDDPYVIEFNARLGDPETQTLLQRIDGDLLPALLSIKNQTLDQQPISISQNHVATVVVCAENYPDTPVKGDLINLPQETDDASVYLAGAIGDGAQLRTSGGRVLSCTGSGQNPLAALKAAYGLVEKTSFRGMQFRKDIGQDLLTKQVL
jgi:phosphoribosylamine--glycine ligase